jgi:hypothetical protein
MLVRTIMILAALLALGMDEASAKSHARTHHVRTAVEPVPEPYAGTYLLHPAHNIACDTRYRSTRALPCDQPVWVRLTLASAFIARASEVGSGQG